MSTLSIDGCARGNITHRMARQVKSTASSGSASRSSPPPELVEDPDSERGRCGELRAPPPPPLLLLLLLPSPVADPGGCERPGPSRRPVTESMRPVAGGCAGMSLRSSAAAPAEAPRAAGDSGGRPSGWAGGAWER